MHFPRLAVFSQVFVMIAGFASGQTSADPLLEALDQFCVMTGMNEQRFLTNIEMFQTQQLEGAQLDAAAPGSRLGYFVSMPSGVIFVNLGQNTGPDGQVAKFCSVAAEGYEFSVARDLIQQNFDAQLLESSRQGSSEYALFQADLIGFPGPMGLFVQGGAGMATLSVTDILGSLEE